MQEPLREALETLAAQSAAAARLALPHLVHLDGIRTCGPAGLGTFSFHHRSCHLFYLRRTARAPRFSSPTGASLLAACAPDRCRRFRATAGGWLKAQGMLMLITFGELTLGFLFLGVDLSILLAALTALVDALPVFGTGTVLIPWALLELLSGRFSMALGLFVLYLIVSLVRSLLEPKLVGDRVGLPPLAALLCMYVGFRAFGVVGMVLSPWPPS
ncbi:MAG: AI-2E family transporter [Intestinimonas sp.]